jgi:hypothetical protein
MELGTLQRLGIWLDDLLVGAVKAVALVGIAVAVLKSWEPKIAADPWGELTSPLTIMVFTIAVGGAIAGVFGLWFAIWRDDEPLDEPWWGE